MTRVLTQTLMKQTLTAAVLLAGTAIPAAAVEQPNRLAHPAVAGYFYAAGRAYLGVDIRDVTTDRVSVLKLKEERGVEIVTIDSDAPAGKAGLREHDVILDFNGTAVESEEQLRRLIREIPPGRTVAIGISRDGNPMKINVQLADHSAMVAQAQRPAIPVIRIPDFPSNGMDVPIEIPTYSSALGVQTENLTRQLGEFFGVKNGEGILVRSVEKGGTGEKAGLKAGDVIIRANNEKLTDRIDLSHILRSHRKGGKMSLVVIRDKHEQTITVTLPERGARDSSMLNPDELQDSLENAQGFLQNLTENENLISLANNLTTLNTSVDLLDRAQHVQMTPEVEKAMRQAEKLLEELQIGSNPI
jgi:serine protease Do